MTHLKNNTVACPGTPQTPDLRDEAVRQVRVAQGVQRLEALQGYVDSDIKGRATEILDTYFQDNTEGDVEGS